MTALTIGRASGVYADASSCEIVRHWIDHPTLADFSTSLRAFIQSLGDDATEDFWRRTLGPIRRLGFTLCSAPIPFNVAADAVSIDWEKLRQQVQLSAQLFPDSHQALTELENKLQWFREEASSPLIEPLERICREGGELYVVQRNPRMNRAVLDYFRQVPTLRAARVVSPSQLRGGHICNVLATIGPCSWFPEHVFSAPRATVVHVLTPRWIRDHWEPQPVFLHGTDAAERTSNSHRIGTMPRFSGASESQAPSPTDLLPGELLPQMPAFDRKLRDAQTQAGITEETLPARLCYVSGNRAVLVPADDGSTSLVIDTSELGHATVKRIGAGELEPGHNLLLRTAGGGDFIVPLADQILGDAAARRRSQQSEWKRSLIEAATEQFGQIGRRDLAARISADLQSRNLSQARPANVHYWMSSKCIRPRKREDFEAILEVAGLRDRAEELWSAMLDIDSAHRRAGHAIRRLLLQQIATVSLEPLERDGEMLFELGEVDGGNLTAYQIIAIGEDDYDVPAEQIGLVMELED